MIWLTELSNVREGLYWARELKGEDALGRGAWVIVCVEGNIPFLSCYVLVYLDFPGTSNWRRGADRRDYDFNPAKWEFGPRIDIPSDKGRAEYAPRSAQERTLA